MKNGWQKVKLNNVAEQIRNLYEPNSQETIPYIGLEHIEQESLKLNGIGRSSDTQSTKKKFSNGDILFGSLRPYFRKVVRPKFGGVCSTDITVLRTKSGYDQSFLHYFIANKAFIDHATNISSGTRMPRANWEVLAKSEWLFPELPTQRKIASILSAYDNMIENNTRRIKILEQMAQAIYREWFVEFRSPNVELRMATPEEQKLTGKNVFPKGWEISTMGETFIIKYGKMLPTTKISENGKYPVYGAGSVIGFYDEKLSDNKVALVTCRGNGSGTVWRTREPAFVTNNSFIITAKTHKSFYEYFYVEQLLRMANINSVKSGSAQPQITIEGLSTVNVILPQDSVVRSFSEIGGPLNESIDLLYKTNNNLRRTRDLLLPKLISGEVEVEGMEIFGKTA